MKHCNGQCQVDEEAGKSLFQDSCYGEGIWKASLMLDMTHHSLGWALWISQTMHSTWRPVTWQVLEHCQNSFLFFLYKTNTWNSVSYLYNFNKLNDQSVNSLFEFYHYAKQSNIEPPYFFWFRIHESHKII